MSQELLDHVVAGALYDFGGYLTTRPERMTVSAVDNAAPMADAIKDFMTLRGVDQECKPMTMQWSARCSMLRAPKQSPVAAAFETLKAAMREDPAYAWSWHCNIAMALIEEGAPFDTGNAAAARFMQMCFGVDTTKTPTAAAPDAGELVSG